MNSPEISVVVPTYNRAALLKRALLSLFSQRAEGVSFEIVVIDNNSTDATQETLESLKRDSPVKLFSFCERAQGNAHARNTGIEQAHARIIAFLDDDVVADQNWVRTIKYSFEKHSRISFVGGRVLPLWPHEQPAWLTRLHWAPLALLDYGEEEKTIGGQAPLGLLTANLSIRREVFDQIGGFSPALQRIKDGIGSMEDHEFLLRASRAGRSGLYQPNLIVRSPVDPVRITKSYHRRWHGGHGRFYAIMKDVEWERSKFYLAGVPSHLYKEAVSHTAAWIVRSIRGDAKAAFESECHLRFFYGFLSERRKRS